MNLLLFASIVIRLAALIWCVLLWRRERDWRLAILTALLGVMVLCSASWLTNSAPFSGNWTIAGERDLKTLSEFAASILALAFVVALGRFPNWKQTGPKRTLKDESDENFRMLADSIPISIAISQDGKRVYANHWAERLNGYSHEELVGMKDGKLTHPDWKDQIAAQREECIRTGDVVRQELKMIRKGGEERWVDFSNQPIVHNGRPAILATSVDITERKQIDEELRIRDRAFSSSTQGIVISDATQPELPIVYCNPAFERMTGYASDEVLGRNCRFLQSDDRNQSGIEAIRTAIADGREVTTVLRNYRKDGSAFWNEVCISPVRDENGHVTHLIGIQNDISKRKQAEEALRDSEEKWRSLTENSDEYLLALDTEFRIQFCNRAAQGLSLEDLIGKPLYMFAEEDQRDEVLNKLTDVRRTGNPVEYETEHHTPDGPTIHYESRVSPRIVDGKIVGLTVSSRDITDRKNAEAKHRQTLCAVDRSQTAFLQVDSESRFMYANDAVSSTLGFSREELQGMSVSDVDTLVPKDAWPELWKRIKSATSLSFESRHRRKDGTELPVEITANYVNLDNHEFIFAYATDITERKNAERLLSESETRFRTLVEHATEAIVVLDVDEGRFVDFNENALQLFKVDRDALLKLGPADLSPPTQPDGRRSDEAAREFVSQAVDGRVPIFEWTHLDSSGAVIPCEIRLVRFPSADRIRLRGAITDITARKKAEQELRDHRQLLAHVSRLSTMGEMVAGIAHEVKQPLHAISNFATASSVALRNIAQDGDIQSDVLSELLEWNDDIQRASQRASDIIRRLRDFSRKGEQRRRLININDVVRDSIELGAFEAKQHGVTVETNLARGLPEVLADAVQCEQVLVNLLHNAYEALADIDPPRRVIVETQCSDGFARLKIADNGPGIRPEQLGRLFEAFFTTKRQGMGLGLAISRTIVEDHGGRLGASGNEFGGATFYFTIPTTGTESQPVIETIATESAPERVVHGN